MYDQIECPYCATKLEVDHDDGYGYEEDVRHEQGCIHCEKIFTYTTSTSYYYETFKADCLNGADHKMRPVVYYPKMYTHWNKCEDCEHEEKGEMISC